MVPPMKHLERILVGVDFSDPSDHALRAASRFAGWSDARLIALHTLPTSIADSLKEHFALDEEKVSSEVFEWVEKRLDGVLGKGHKAIPEFCVGHAHDGIISTAEKLNVDLLVLGATGSTEGDIPRTVGLVAGRCIQKSPVDVLLVRGEQTAPFRKVVACVDFSSTSKKAARRAVEIAQHEGAELEFLHVYQAMAAYLTANLGYLSTLVPSAPVHLKDLEPEKIRQNVDDFVRPIVEEAGGHPFEVRVEKGFDARSTIANHLVEMDVDLVVLGTRGDSDLRNFLLGTTAENVLRYAPCSALAVKPD